MTLELEIEGGRVREATARGVGALPFRACLSAVARSLEFPEVEEGASLLLVYPLLFRPGEPAPERANEEGGTP